MGFKRKKQHRIPADDFEIIQKDLDSLYACDDQSLLPNEKFKDNLHKKINTNAALISNPAKVKKEENMKLGILAGTFRKLKQAPTLASIIIGVLAISTISFAASEKVREIVLSPFQPKAWLEISYAENGEQCESLSPIVKIDDEIESRIPLKIKLATGAHRLFISRTDAEPLDQMIDLSSDGIAIEISCLAKNGKWEITFLNAKKDTLLNSITLAPLSAPLATPISTPITMPETPTLPDPPIDELPPVEKPPAAEEPPLVDNPVEKPPVAEEPPLVDNPIEQPPINNEPDTTAPVLTSLRFDQDSIMAGEQITAILKVTEEESGIGTIALVLWSPSHNQTVSNSASSISADGTATLTFSISATAELGSWSLRDLQMNDKVDNTSNYASSDIDASFEVVANPSTVPDETPPELLSLAFDKASVMAGNEIKATIKVKEEGSGISSIAVVLWSSSHNQTVSNTASSLDLTGRTTLAFSISASAELGTWSVRDIQMDDKDGNTSNYEESDIGASFEVIANPEVKPDETPPELLSFTFVKETIKAGEQLIANIKVKEEGSGISSICTVLWSPSGAQTASNCIHSVDATGRASIVFTIPSNSEAGIWSVRDIQMDDTVGNTSNYETTDIPASFTVTK